MASGTIKTHGQSSALTPTTGITFGKLDLFKHNDGTVDVNLIFENQNVAHAGTIGTLPSGFAPRTNRPNVPVIVRTTDDILTTGVLYFNSDGSVVIYTSNGVNAKNLWASCWYQL